MWSKYIQEILDAGLTQSQIGESIDASQSTVSDLLRGAIKEPVHSKGEAIKKLHRKCKRIRKSS